MDMDMLYMLFGSIQYGSTAKLSSVERCSANAEGNLNRETNPSYLKQERRYRLKTLATVKDSQ